jgi:hypothetical protein
MKKYFLLVLTLVKGFCLIGQIPNPSFETWTVNSWSNPYPQGWSVIQTPVNCTYQYSIAQQGSSAFKFENFQWQGQWVDLSANTVKEKFKLFLPQEIEGFSKQARFASR